MLKKCETLKRITAIGIVAVVRANTTEEAITIAKACIEGGIPAIEITFTVPGAELVIKNLNEKFTEDELIIGAGTVLDSETARLAILNGSKYIVSPHFEESIAKCCNRYSIPYMPGCLTIKEIVSALEYGVDIIKLFPGSAFGSGFIKSIKGPLPHVNIMPTGGVDIDNVDLWIQNGAVAIGVGSALTKGTPKQITEMAKRFVTKIQEARRNL